MFIYQTRVRLRDTDATGVLYFTEQLRMAVEAFEAGLEASHFSLKNLLNSNYLLPIVHVEADYKAPLAVGDSLEVSLRVVKLGDTSFTLQSVFHAPEQKKEVGKVEIVHVVIERKNKTPASIPDFLREVLSNWQD